MFYCPGRQHVVTMCSISQRIKFTAVLQHFPFIVLYRYGDTHWSQQIILFIIEHYPHTFYNQIYSLSGTSALWHINRYPCGKRGDDPVVWFLWWYPWRTVHPSRRWYLCLLCLREIHLTFSWWYTLTRSGRNAKNWYHKKKKSLHLISQHCLIIVSSEEVEIEKRKITQQCKLTAVDFIKMAKSFNNYWSSES